ncbi:lysine exporter LysO family protein [Sulfolobus tengchongensis]|uniref:Lysine exporter LysO family protein n=1 Tax=Sulfolobus tengchongensis TaxID=207809 RepID=A0AAX4L3T6_9CREN
MNNEAIFFITLYLVFLAFGKVKYIKGVERITDVVVVMLILTISYWAGEEITINEVLTIIFTSLALSILSILITYFSGITIDFYNRKILIKKGENMKIRYEGADKGGIVKYMAPFVIGWILGLFIHISTVNLLVNLVNYELYALASILGYIMGKDLNLKILLNSGKDSLLSILITILGDILLAVIIFALRITNFSVALVIALASGWYSYVGPLVAVSTNPYLGTLAFLINFLREQFTYILVPLLLRLKFEPRSAIAVGGATAMDTTLPLYVETLGKEYALSAMVTGVLLTLVIPIILPLII